ncbi:winged helix-turn-helix DNA-binding domain, RNA polymerase Rpc34-like protein [Artemisia annua]|uniref:Winged helix-turn-helix DNA-binding domain, RNA polymerase Rpc34-like protein n=1 Tax=Artemisia annua TaxID=35608 RepID=A0A2U1LTS0_ARTAN|nr:winged helix-turn-helix DNA-binding domain, RNA polymerase Rpc34-like protein [Artemisia annua]
MSQSRNGPKQPALVTRDDRVVLNLIESKGDQAISVKNIQTETGLSQPTVKKCIKTLLTLKLIKEVRHVQAQKGLHYIAAKFMPTDDVTGGSWYVDGKLDAAFINQLKEICLKILKKLTVATSAGVYDFIKSNGLINNDQCTSGHISEILASMVLDNVIIEVKSTGLKEYHSIPIGNVCYRAAHDQGPKIGAMASLPCGMCPHFKMCTPDGRISPSTCDYFTKWLEY